MVSGCSTTEEDHKNTKKEDSKRRSQKHKKEDSKRRSQKHKKRR